MKTVRIIIVQKAVIYSCKCIIYVRSLFVAIEDIIFFVYQVSLSVVEFEGVCSFLHEAHMGY